MNNEILNKLRNDKDLEIEEDGIEFGELYILLDRFLVTIYLKGNQGKTFKVEDLKEEEINEKRMSIERFRREYFFELTYGIMLDNIGKMIAERFMKEIGEYNG